MRVFVAAAVMVRCPGRIWTVFESELFSWPALPSGSRRPIRGFCEQLHRTCSPGPIAPALHPWRDVSQHYSARAEKPFYCCLGILIIRTPARQVTGSPAHRVTETSVGCSTSTELPPSNFLRGLRTSGHLLPDTSSRGPGTSDICRVPEHFSAPLTYGHLTSITVINFSETLIFWS